MKMYLNVPGRIAYIFQIVHILNDYLKCAVYNLPLDLSELGEH